jgi:uncharacterized protein (TIGR02271 family)
MELTLTVGEHTPIENEMLPARAQARTGSFQGGTMNRRDVREGMIVRAMDGEKLGKVISCQDSEFIIEKGFFFPKDYVARYEDAESRDGELLLRQSAAELRELGESGVRASAAAPQPGGSRIPAGTAGSRIPAGAKEEVKVPLVEEELAAEKRTKETGQVRVRKDVTTEQKEVTVPVTKEEVRVERVPAGGEARPGDTSFQKGTVTVPVREEEVEVRKRPIVREEVRVSKTPEQVERRAGAEVRKESADIEKEGDIHPSGTGIGEPD